MVIVVGGESGISDTFLTSVELYNEVTETWHYGPELPFGIGHGVLVEDSMGGVILVYDPVTYYCKILNFLETVETKGQFYQTWI